MPRSKNTTRTPKAKTKSHVLTHTAKQKVAPTPLLERWAKTVCDNGDDAALHTSTFLLLIAELEQSARNPERIAEICWVVQKAAFAESEQAENALRELVGRLRAKNGLQAVA